MNADVSTEPAQRRARVPIEMILIASIVSQQLGTAIAVTLFDEINPQSVAWLRGCTAAAVLMFVSRRQWRPWTKPELRLVAAYGLASIAMNTVFYLAIDRLPLGKGLAIEFIGPITVAAVRTRNRRNAAALGLAVVGVGVLSGVELTAEPVGLALILIASVGWATHIVLGARVAKLDRGVNGLAVALAIGAAAIAPISAIGTGHVWTSPSLLALCVVVGLLTNVVGYGLDQHVFRRMSVRRYVVMLSLIPVVAVIFGFMILDQTPSVVDLIGVAFVVAAVGIQDRS